MCSNAKIIRSEWIKSRNDLWELDFIRFQGGLNGYWRNPEEAMDTIASWFVGRAVYSIVDVGDGFYTAPERTDFPDWKHVGNHVKVGKQYWNWFHQCSGADEELHFSDSPDFWGRLGSNSFWGDIGRVSASALAFTQKQMGEHDLWISILDTSHQLVIETQKSLRDLWWETLKGGRRVRNAA